MNNPDLHRQSTGSEPQQPVPKHDVPTPTNRALRPIAFFIFALFFSSGLFFGGSLLRNNGKARLDWVNYENAGGELHFRRISRRDVSGDPAIGDVRSLTDAEIQFLLPELSFSAALGFFYTPDLPAHEALSAGELYCMEGRTEGGTVFVGVPGYSPKDIRVYDTDHRKPNTSLDGEDLFGGYFISSPNIRGEQTITYSVVFRKDGFWVEIDLSDRLENRESLALRVTDLTRKLLSSSAPDFSAVSFAAGDASDAF